MNMKSNNSNSINTDLFPQDEEIFGFIKDLTQWSHRKTGTPEGLKSAEYIKNKFKEFGLEKILTEHPQTTIYTPEKWNLIVQGEEIPSYFINFVYRNEKTGTCDTGKDGITTEIIYVGDGKEEDFDHVDVRGKIVCSDVKFMDTSVEDFLQFGTGDCFAYDPRNTLGKGPVGKNVYTPKTFPFNYFNALKRGAVGFIGILDDYFDHCTYYNEDYTEHGYSYGFEYMTIPGLWISRSSGEKIKNMIKYTDKEVKANLQMKVTAKEGDSNIVSGILPGKSDDIILVHSHHDAVFNGAVQDASGISEVLALAKYFSMIPPEKREKTLMFAAMDTHYTDYRGHLGFIENRKKNKDNIILDVVLEHIGKEVIIGKDGNPVITGEVEMRSIFVNENKALLSIVKNAVIKNNLDRTLILPVNAETEEVISDACYFHRAGVPVISLLSGQTYVFDPMDTIEMIPIEQLRSVGIVFAEIVENTSKLDVSVLTKYDVVDNIWLNQ